MNKSRAPGNLPRNKIRIVVLAAGRGTRMGGDRPKVLAQVKGKSMIKRILESVAKAKIDKKPIIVVGHKKELVIRELGREKYHYLNQERQLGTGHAVSLAKNYLKDKAENIMVLYGDHPLLSVKTIKKIIARHLKSGKKITLATVKLKNFEDWRVCFKNFSRIVRNKNGKIIKDVQFKDAGSEEKKITEVNPCYYCFEAAWLWSKLETLNNHNAQKEYYLTDLIKIATENDMEIESVKIDAPEALGANTREELLILEKFAS